MNLIRATFNCCDRVDNPESAILVPVPIEPDAATLFFNNALYKTDYGARSVGGGMPVRIADTNCFGAAPDSGGIERP